jgi:hypothetical protein
VTLVWAIVGQTLDATSMALMVTTVGVAAEVNPIVHSFGVGSALVMKVALMVFLVGASRLWHPSLRTTVLVLAAGAGLVGALSNAWAMA